MRAWLVLLSVRLWWAPVLTTNFDTGCAAFDRGDYATAREEWAPLAKE